MAVFTEALIFFLAVWRGSKIITEEEGPGMVFTRLREVSGAEYNGVPEQWDLLSWYAKLLQCVYCISVWTSLVLVILRLVNKDLFSVITFVLAGSGATALIEDFKNG